MIPCLVLMSYDQSYTFVQPAVQTARWIRWVIVSYQCYWLVYI